MITTGITNRPSVQASRRPSASGPCGPSRREPSDRRGGRQDASHRHEPRGARGQVQRDTAVGQHEPEQRRPRRERHARPHANGAPRSSSEDHLDPQREHERRREDRQRRRPQEARAGRSPCSSAASFMSIIGPDTRNASCAGGPNDTNDAATNASDSEHSDIRNASPIIATRLNTGSRARPSHDGLRHERLDGRGDGGAHDQEPRHEDDVTCEVRDEPGRARFVARRLLHLEVAGARPEQLVACGWRR